MQTFLNLAYGNDPEQMLDVHLPDTKATAAFLYFHGGGIVGGDKTRDVHFPSKLADNGVALFSANYRMYPNARYPEFIEDAASAVAFAKAYIDEHLDGVPLYVGGSSAGGYLSMMLCFDSRYLRAVGLDNSAIAGYFHDAGQPTAHFNVLKNADVDPRRVIVDERAPLYYVGIEKSYPKMRFLVSDHDMECRYEQTMLLLATLKHFGYEHYDHIVMNGTHCAYCHRYDENGISEVGQMILDFIEADI